MDLIRLAIVKPVSVIVGIILVVLFGLVSLQLLPYQLTPDVTEPEISVTTLWPGATPYEVERDIIEEQERVLKGIPGLVEMESSSANSQGTITLRFRTGTRVDDALLKVSNKLDEVPSYPENVEKPVLNATGAATSPVIWMILKSQRDNPRPAGTYRTYFEDEIRQYLERIQGVADLFVGGGTERQVHLVVSAEKLAACGLTIQDLISVVRQENINISAGSLGLGRREYRIRTVAAFGSPEEIEGIVIRSTGQRRVTVSDVARVSFGYAKRTVSMIHNAKEGIAIGVKPEPGTNVLDMTDRVEAAVRWLNEEKLKPQGIYLDWVYDQRPYIRGAIDLVKDDIVIGGALAVAALLLFLRSVAATVVVATAIPISIIGTFISLYLLGRNLNVISLAGISFAVGILVSNAIVVLENIDRHRKMGKGPADAAHDGAKEVWGAILNTTVSTIAVFLPVVFVEEEAGQLFKDIAIAVSCAVTFSLLVSILVIPMLSQRLFRAANRRGAGIVGRTLERVGGALVGAIMTVVRLVLRGWAIRLGVALDVLMDGRKIGEFQQEGQRTLDLIVKASETEVASPEALYESLVATPGGRVVPVSTIAELQRTVGVSEIRHLERRRTFTLQITPPIDLPVQEAMEIIDEKVIAASRAQGMLQGVEVKQSGVADKLTQARRALQWNLLLAALITFLIMAALFENFVYPLVIMITLPLGAAGGFMGLELVSTTIAPQPFDILTMLGFIISIGIVVDNATLIVYQALNNVRDYGMGHREAVLDATRTRIRPITMTTTTSVLGMLPLVVAPGPGSELYRGLGSVVLGGIIFSTLLTLLVIPSLLLFVIRMEKGRAVSAGTERSRP